MNKSDINDEYINLKWGDEINWGDKIKKVDEMYDNNDTCEGWFETDGVELSFKINCKNK